MELEHVAVFGSTGRTGRLIVKRLVERGIKVTAVSRSEAVAQEAFMSLPRANKLVTIIQGDLLRMPAEAINNVLKSCDFCICAVGTRRYSNIYKDIFFRPEGNHPYFVDYLGVARIAGGCERVGTINRLVVISSAGVLRPWHPVSFLHNAILSMVLKYKVEGERAVRAKNLSYTIVRPGRLVNADVSDPAQIKIQQGDTMNGINGLPRLALADLCLAALSREDITRLTLDVDSKTMLPLMPTKYSQRTSTNGSEQNYYDWAPLFDTVKPDSKFLPEVYHSFPIAITVVLGVTIPIVATLLLLLLRLVGLRT